MLFSLVVPVYNAIQTIRSCLDSILHQFFTDYEVIIINDGSTDDSKKICDEYTKKYCNFKLYSFKNSGVAISRKRGIALSTGQYIIFVDSDDTINPDLLKSIANVLLLHPNLDIIRYQANLVNDDCHKNHDRYNFKSHTNIVYTGIEALRLWTSSNFKYAVYWLFAFKHSLFLEVGEMPNLKCYEDVAYIPLLITSAKEVLTIEYCGYNYTYGRCSSLTNNSNQFDRACSFCQACQFAVENFCQLKCVNDDDVSFFKNDYRRRLQSFFDGMNPDLKEKLSNMFNISSFLNSNNKNLPIK